MVRSLANVILKKVWARLLLLRQRLLQEEENTRKQNESRQENLLADLALSAKEQIQNQVEKDLDPRLDILLAKKVKPQAMRKKESVMKKERHVKLGSNFQIAKAAKMQFKSSDPQDEDTPADNDSTLFKFA